MLKRLLALALLLRIFRFSLFVHFLARFCASCHNERSAPHFLFVWLYFFSVCVLKKLSMLFETTTCQCTHIHTPVFIVSHGVMFNHSQNLCDSNIIYESKPAVNVFLKNTRIPMNHSKSYFTIHFNLLKVHMESNNKQRTKPKQMNEREKKMFKARFLCLSIS